MLQYVGRYRAKAEPGAHKNIEGLGFIDKVINIDKKQVHLTEPIRKLGIYQVEIKLQPEITASTKVWVVKK